MPSVYDPENFIGRVNLAAMYISQGRDSTRSFDTCFEMDDGDLVAVALYRRAESNPKLAANITRYLSQSLKAETLEKYKDIPTRKLADVARRVRAEQRAAANKWLAEFIEKQKESA